MNYSEILFAEDIDADVAEDEMDAFITEMLHVEPPADLVDKILSTVSRLPLPQNIPSTSLNDLSGLLVHNDLRSRS